MRHLRHAWLERASAALRKSVVGLVFTFSLSGSWLLCGVAHASGDQIVVEGGERFGDAVHKSGHDVPLLRAIEEVVPPSYSVMVPNAGAWADTPVSWHSGPAVRALGEVLAANASLQAHVNTDLRIVTVTVNARLAHDAELAPASAAPAHAEPTLSAKPDDAPASARTIPSVATASSIRADVPPFLSAQAAPELTPTQQTVSASMHPAASALSQPPASLSAQPSVSTSMQPSAPAVAATRTTMPTSAPALVPQDNDPASSTLAPQPERMEWQVLASDRSVRNVLARWASEAGWQFIWDVPTDFAVDATATVHGTFEHALQQVVEALAGSQVPIHVILYERNRVLRVVPKGAG